MTRYSIMRNRSSTSMRTFLISTTRNRVCPFLLPHRQSRLKSPSTVSTAHRRLSSHSSCSCISPSLHTPSLSTAARYWPAAPRSSRRATPALSLCAWRLPARFRGGNSSRTRPSWRGSSRRPAASCCSRAVRQNPNPLATISGAFCLCG